MVAAKLRKRSVLSDFALRINSLSARLSTTSGTARKCVIRAQTQHCAYERLQHFHLSMAAYQVDYTPSQLLMNRSPFSTLYYFYYVYTLCTPDAHCAHCAHSVEGVCVEVASCFRLLQCSPRSQRSCTAPVGQYPASARSFLVSVT
jgi:hypothetical protein